MVPFLFWATTRWLQERSLRRWALSAALVALQLLGGHPETTAHTVFLLGLYVVALQLQLRPLWANARDDSVRGRVSNILGGLVGWAASIAAGTAMAAIQVVPTMAAISGSVTAAERGS